MALAKPVGPLDPGEDALRQVLLKFGIAWDFQHLREAARQQGIDCDALARLLRAAHNEFNTYAFGGELGIGEKVFRFHIARLRSAMDSWPLPLPVWDAVGTAEVWEVIEWSPIGTSVRQLRARREPSKAADIAARRAQMARSTALTLYANGAQVQAAHFHEKAELWDYVISLCEARQPLRKVRDQP